MEVLFTRCIQTSNPTNKHLDKCIGVWSGYITYITLYLALVFSYAQFTVLQTALEYHVIVVLSDIDIIFTAAYSSIWLTCVSIC